MTQEHLTPEQIERFALPLDSPDSERTRANAHIQSCAPCRLAFQQAMRSSPPALSADRRPDRAEIADRAEIEGCPAVEIMVRVAEGAASAVETRAVEAHLEICAVCRSEMAALTAFYNSLELPAQMAEAKRAAAKEPAQPTREAVVFAQEPRQESSKAVYSLPVSGAGRRFRLAEPRSKWSLALGASALAAAAWGTLLWLHSGGLGQTSPPGGAQNTASSTARAVPQQKQLSHVNSPAPVEQRLASLARRGERTMGDAGAQAIALYSPDSVVVNSLRPTFRWKAVSRAAAYRLTCIPQISKDNKNKNDANRQADVISYMVPSDAATSQADIVWAIPATQPALWPATKYTWIVRAMDANRHQTARSSTHEELFFSTPDLPPTPAQ